jgi:hypothetical protein
VAAEKHIRHFGQALKSAGNDEGKTENVRDCELRPWGGRTPLRHGGVDVVEQATQNLKIHRVRDEAVKQEHKTALALGEATTQSMILPSKTRTRRLIGFRCAWC